MLWTSTLGMELDSPEVLVVLTSNHSTISGFPWSLTSVQSASFYLNYYISQMPDTRSFEKGHQADSRRDNLGTHKGNKGTWNKQLWDKFPDICYLAYSAFISTCGGVHVKKQYCDRSLHTWVTGPQSINHKPLSPFWEMPSTKFWPSPDFRKKRNYHSCGFNG